MWRGVEARVRPHPLHVPLQLRRRAEVEVEDRDVGRLVVRHIEPLAVRADREAAGVSEVCEAVTVLVDIFDGLSGRDEVEAAVVLVLKELSVVRRVEEFEDAINRLLGFVDARRYIVSSVS